MKKQPVLSVLLDRIPLAVGLLVGVLMLAGVARAADTIGAIGHLQPQRGIITVSGPAGDAVAAILVEPGDMVELGQPLVRLQGEASSRTQLQAAELAFKEADEGGAHMVELARLGVAVAREAHATATARLERYLELTPSSISAQEKELRASVVTATEMELRIAEQTLTEARFSREIAMAKTRNQLEQAQQQVARTLPTAPLRGTVLSCPAVLGAPAHSALVLLADLSEMVVVAQVFEGDLLKFEVGAPAVISSASLPEDLTAEVIRIGRRISGQSRVAEVHLKLMQSELAARFIGMEVNVAIEL